MIGSLALVTAVLIAIGALLQLRSSARTQAMLSDEIRASIERKGQAIVDYHALALRGLVVDNAYGDVQRLMEASRRNDQTIAYNLFLDNELKPWIYTSPSGTQSPEAWREIGVDSEFVTADRPRFGRRELFGGQIFEFSAPVRDDEGARIGVVVYGFWAAPLEAALARAKQASRNLLVVSVSLLSVLAAASLLLGWVLARRAAERITRPLAELTRATSALAAGNRNLRVSIQSQDELEELGNSFNGMVGELNDSYARLEELNHTLEQRVDERTRELGKRNQDLRLVLDTVNDGLLTVFRDGTLAEGHSAKIDQWFGGYSGPTRLVDFLARLSPDFARHFAANFDALIDDSLPMEVNLAQLPRRMHHADRDFLFHYFPVMEAEVLTGVVVAITDVTEQTALSKQEALQRELLALLQGLMRDRVGFLAFFQEATTQVEQIVARSSDLTTHKRLVHTLKGNASSASLDVVSRLCHSMEDELDEGLGVALTANVRALGERWESLKNTLAQFSGVRDHAVAEVEPQDISSLQQDIARGMSTTELSKRLGSWLHTPAKKLLERLADQARSLAVQLGRDDVVVRIEDDGSRFDLERWGPLWSALIHLVRNAVDHGIESPSERVSQGKHRIGQLRLSVRSVAESMVIEVEDDGRGIDWEGVRRSAEACGLPIQTRQDLQLALLGHGLSSKTTITETSGRGVGLGALSQCVRALGGTVSVSSQTGLGTSWRLTFPLTPSAAISVPGTLDTAPLSDATAGG